MQLHSDYNLAGVPLESAVGAVRMSLINDNWVVQATNSEIEESVFDMVVAGSLNSSGEVDIVMVEAGATDNAFAKIDKAALLLQKILLLMVSIHQKNILQN
jgi:polyribonucleotide nucleotidyltransferase